MKLFLIAAAVVVLSTIGLRLMVNRNLRQRAIARRLRDIFIAQANDLIGKSELPDRHAAQLIEFAAVPAGWLTRYMVFVLFRKILTGAGPRSPNRSPLLDDVPAHLKAKYVMAVLALALSDSYRCAILGRVWRGANGWVNDAVREVKPDVNAHATRRVIDAASRVHAPRHLAAAAKQMECVA